MDTCVGQISIVKLTHLDRAGGDAAPQSPLQGPPGDTRLAARAVLEALVGRGRRDGVGDGLVVARQGLLGLLHSRASIRELCMIEITTKRVSERAGNRHTESARPS